MVGREKAKKIVDACIKRASPFLRPAPAGGYAPELKRKLGSLTPSDERCLVLSPIRLVLGLWLIQGKGRRGTVTYFKLAEIFC